MIYLEFTVTKEFFIVKLYHTFCNAKRLLQTTWHTLFMIFIRTCCKKCRKIFQINDTFKLHANMLQVCSTLQPLFSMPSGPKYCDAFCDNYKWLFFCNAIWFLLWRFYFFITNCCNMCCKFATLLRIANLCVASNVFSCSVYILFADIPLYKKNMLLR